MPEVQCEYCGEYFDKRGLGAHQTHCDAAQEEYSQPDYSDQLVTQVRARDQDICVSCGVDDDLTFHKINPTVDGEVRNLTTLCTDCVSDVEGFHPRTKRTKIHSDY